MNNPVEVWLRELKAAPGSLPLAALSALLSLLAVAFWWQTALGTAAARLAALQPIEPYGFAVYHQIVHNLALHDSFAQTIHTGYDPTWTWSGHRAPILFPVAWLYSLAPSGQQLMNLQVTGVALGAIPAMGLGRQALRHPLGWMLGAALYLGCGPTLAMALQDYQDLVFALPALVLFAWSLGKQDPAWLVLGVLAAILPREETLPIAVALAVLLPPFDDRGALKPRRWLGNVAFTALSVGAYALWSQWAFPAEQTGYNMPMVNAVGGLGGGSSEITLHGYLARDDFYADMLHPGGWTGLLAPGPLLLGLALSLFHMALPLGQGIDRAWSGHAHHLAPAVALFVIAAIRGAGRLVLLPERLSVSRRLQWGVEGLLLALVLAVSTTSALSFARAQNVLWAPARPHWVHPGWALARQIPADAVPITTTDLAPLVSDRAVAYTANDSLEDKAPGRGLGVGTHALFHRDDAQIRQRVLAMPGATLVAESAPFMLYTWDRGARDPAGSFPREEGFHRPPPFLGPYSLAEEIPGIAPYQDTLQWHQGEHPPAIVIPWLDGKAPPAAPLEGGPGAPPQSPQRSPMPAPHSPR
ncbi:MAG: DUF2079 domain-containing protein [Myxococcota bacterium]|nr:DUF2079 domain-containing protein [Myxococcota bacterium]